MIPVHLAIPCKNLITERRKLQCTHFCQDLTSGNARSCIGRIPENPDVKDATFKSHRFEDGYSCPGDIWDQIGRPLDLLLRVSDPVKALTWFYLYDVHFSAHPSLDTLTLLFYRSITQSQVKSILGERRISVRNCKLPYLP